VHAVHNCIILLSFCISIQGQKMTIDCVTYTQDWLPDTIYVVNVNIVCV